MLFGRSIYNEDVRVNPVDGFKKDISLLWFKIKLRENMTIDVDYPGTLIKLTDITNVSTMSYKDYMEKYKNTTDLEKDSKKDHYVLIITRNYKDTEYTYVVSCVPEKRNNLIKL